MAIVTIGSDHIVPISETSDERSRDMRERVKVKAIEAEK